MSWVRSVTDVSGLDYRSLFVEIAQQTCRTNRSSFALLQEALLGKGFART